MLVFNFRFGFEPILEIVSGRATVAFPKKIGAFPDSLLQRGRLAIFDRHENSPLLAFYRTGETGRRFDLGQTLFPNIRRHYRQPVPPTHGVGLFAPSDGERYISG
jgi:hypothetical protein